MLEGIVRDSITKAAVKALRKEGYLIANIYGKGLENISAAFKRNDFIKYLRNKNTLAFDVSVAGKTLKVVVQANNAGDTAFIVDVTQAGIFLIDAVEEERLPYILGAYCPNILFPYAREVIASLVSKGSFPELHLSPINFDALYARRLQEEQAKAGA